MAKSDVIAAVMGCMDNHPVPPRDTNFSDYDFDLQYLNEEIGGSLFDPYTTSRPIPEVNSRGRDDRTRKLDRSDANEGKRDKASKESEDNRARARRPPNVPVRRVSEEDNLTSGDDPVPSDTEVRRRRRNRSSPRKWGRMCRFGSPYLIRCLSALINQGGRRRKQSPIQPGRTPRKGSVSTTTKGDRANSGRTFLPKPSSVIVRHDSDLDHVPRSIPTNSVDIERFSDWLPVSTEVAEEELLDLTDMLNDISLSIRRSVPVIPWFRIRDAFEGSNKPLVNAELVRSRKLEANRCFKRTYLEKKETLMIPSSNETSTKLSHPALLYLNLCEELGSGIVSAVFITELDPKSSYTSHPSWQVNERRHWVAVEHKADTVTVWDSLPGKSIRLTRKNTDPQLLNQSVALAYFRSDSRSLVSLRTYLIRY